MHRHASSHADAQIAEARGEFDGAATGYSEAADAWEGFGFVPEQALALLGNGRCLVALDDSSAHGPLREARALFDGMGARPRVDACDTLIALASRLSS